MILSRTLEYSSQLPVSVYGTGIQTLNAFPLFLEVPSVLRFSRNLRSAPYSVRTQNPRHSVRSQPAWIVQEY